MVIYREDIKVRYYETDQMAVVHHSNYIRYCELTRIGFLASIGLDFPEFERNGFVSPVLNINLNFRHAAVFGDTITVETSITQFKGVRIWFGYKITNQSGLLLCDGESCHTFCTKDLKPINLKKVLPDVFEKLESASL